MKIHHTIVYIRILMFFFVVGSLIIKEARSCDFTVWLGTTASEREDSILLPQWGKEENILVEKTRKLVLSHGNIEKMIVLVEAFGPSLILKTTSQGWKSINVFLEDLKQHGKKTVVLVVCGKVLSKTDFSGALNKGENLAVTALPYEVLAPLRKVPGVLWDLSDDYIHQQKKEYEKRTRKIETPSAECN